MLKRRIIGYRIPSHLLAGGWFAAQICMISRPVPGEDLENNQSTQSHHNHNLILGLVFIRILAEDIWKTLNPSRYPLPSQRLLSTYLTILLTIRPYMRRIRRNGEIGSLLAVCPTCSQQHTISLSSQHVKREEMEK